MSLVFDIISGPNKGKKFLIEKGILLGRIEGDFILDDSEVSNLHAEVVEDNRGQLVLIGISNEPNLKIQSKLVKKVSLIPGVKFSIGQTSMQVIEISDTLANSMAAKKSPLHSLSDMLFNIRGENDKKPFLLTPFPRSLSLVFTKGYQIDTVVFITYGPRTFGHGHWDINLADIEMPLNAFSIYTNNNNQIILQSIEFNNLYLNNILIESSPIQNGDFIRFLTNEIQIKYV